MTGRVTVIALLAAGCGRPATEAECEEIVARIVELELRAEGVPEKELESQVAESKKEFSEQARRQCVGRRISDGALRCVRNAKTAEEIVERCLD